MMNKPKFEKGDRSDELKDVQNLFKLFAEIQIYLNHKLPEWKQIDKKTRERILTEALDVLTRVYKFNNYVDE